MTWHWFSSYRLVSLSSLTILTGRLSVPYKIFPAEAAGKRKAGREVRGGTVAAGLPACHRAGLPNPAEKIRARASAWELSHVPAGPERSSGRHGCRCCGRLGWLPLQTLPRRLSDPRSDCDFSPSGRLRIAQRFSDGSGRGSGNESRQGRQKSCFSPTISFLPDGTFLCCAAGSHR